MNIPGERPFGEDLTDDLFNIQYCQFTHGTPGKVQDGYYILRRSHAFVEDEGPEGHSYVWSINLFWLGTTSYYKDGYRIKGLDEIANDWEVEVEVAGTGYSATALVTIPAGTNPPLINWNHGQNTLIVDFSPLDEPKSFCWIDPVDVNNAVVHMASVDIANNHVFRVFAY